MANKIVCNTPAIFSNSPVSIIMALIASILINICSGQPIRNVISGTAVEDVFTNVYVTFGCRPSKKVIGCFTVLQLQQRSLVPTLDIISFNII